MRLFNSISAIRQTYIKFLSLQDDKYIKNNVNLNFELMELEEFLVECGIITLEEVKNPNIDQQ